MRGLVRAILVSLLVLALTAAGVAAGNETADTAQVVSAEHSSVQDNLVGTTGGAFRYYRFDYPGANAAVQIHLTWNPGWSSTGPAFGFNVYGPNGLVGQGIRGDDAGPASTANLSLASPSPGSHLVQVYSYTAGSSQAFAVDFTGLGQAPAAVTNNSTPDRAVAIQQATSNLSGSLTGRSSGAFSFFMLEYPGGQWPMTVSLSFSPASALSSDAFGFNLYDGDTLLATGAEVSRSGDTATKSATVSQVAPGLLGLQVFNYAEGVTGSYVVGVNGAAGAVAGVSLDGNAGPDSAVRLSPGQTAARGSVVGNSAGAFGFFWIDYQGSNEPITLSLAFKPGRGLTGTGVGVNLYRGADLVATSALADGRTPGEGVAYLTYSSDQAGAYGIQVYNYVQGVTVDYTFYAMGLKR